MDKPFTLIVQEIQQEIINIINNSKLPAYVLKQILKEIYQQLEQLELNEIETYKQQEEKKPKKKESDK